MLRNVSRKKCCTFVLSFDLLAFVHQCYEFRCRKVTYAEIWAAQNLISVTHPTGVMFSRMVLGSEILLFLTVFVTMQQALLIKSCLLPICQFWKLARQLLSCTYSVQHSTQARKKDPGVVNLKSFVLLFCLTACTKGDFEY